MASSTPSRDALRRWPLRSTTSDPLRPLELAVFVAGALLLGAVALRFGSAMLIGHGHIGVWGYTDGCFDTAASQVRLAGPGSASKLAPGTTLGQPPVLPLCPARMSGLDQVLVALPPLLWFCWAVWLLLGARRIILGARAAGIFTDELADALRRLGLQAFIGWALVETLSAGLLAVVTSHQVVGDHLLRAWAQFNLSWPVVIGGFGLLTVARILRQTTPMRKELEVTV